MFLTRPTLIAAILAGSAMLSCSSSDSSTPSTQTSGSGGGGGSANDDPCKLSICPSEPRAYSAEVCQAGLSGPCGVKFQANIDCYRAHDMCKQDGMQDGAFALNSCGNTLSAVLVCLEGDGGTE
jgi:hypothetical protein